MVNFSDDMWLMYKNYIPVDRVKVITEIPRMNPQGVKYKRWWKDQKRKCIEGFWVCNDEGLWKWVSGPLYFYVNFWHILLNEKGTRSKGKKVAKPFLRDLEWIRSFVYTEARGFSGFENDENYSCHLLLEECHPDENPTEFELRLMEYNAPNLIRASLMNSSGEYKKFIPARDYLYDYKDANLGKPMYFNMNFNVVDLESRGGGKSYWKSCITAHNFTFDGATDYEEYLHYKEIDQPLSSETLIGAGDSKYSGDLVRKVQLGLNNLEGKERVGKKTYPAPFTRQYHGSWEAGKTITCAYDKKIGGSWETLGTFTKFQHRSFKDNPQAANGTRASLSVLDEVGFMGNLIESLGQLKEIAADGTVKSGVIWMTGTGGDMEGGSTEAVKSVFYDPEAFDCLAFPDEFEGYQSKIGLFIPTIMTLNQFKDDLGNTNWRAALTYTNRTREKLKKNAKTKAVYDNEIVQRPIKHSEVFLLNNSSILPTIDLKEHMDKMMSMQDQPGIKPLIGWMHIDESGQSRFKINNELFPADYPVKPNLDNTSAVCVWEEPSPDADYGWYVAGNDPYDFDIAPNSVSLGSIIVIRRGTALNGGFDRIVAEYTGRPKLASDFYEQCRRLLMWYSNATCLYENEKQQIKEHFKKMHSIGLLAYTPGVLKANETSKTAKVRQYGQHMSTTIKKEAEIYLREWLLTPIGDGKLQLHTIKSIPLLKELISYNPDGNFDRVIALQLAVIQLIQMREVIVEEARDDAKSEEVDDFFSRQIFYNQRHFTR